MTCLKSLGTQDSGGEADSKQYKNLVIR